MAPVSKSTKGNAEDTARVIPLMVLKTAGRPRRTEHTDDEMVDGMLFVPVRPTPRGAA